MTRNHLTGLLLAAALSTGGTLAVVVAQDDAGEEAHDHEHTATSVHAGDGTHFDLADEDAFPDPDGFETREERASYAIGRFDAQGIPEQQPDLNIEEYGQGVSAGLEVEAEDYTQGYSLARRILDAGDQMDVESFIEGLQAGLAEDSESRAAGLLMGSSMGQNDVPLSVESYLKGLNEGLALGEAESAEPPAEGEDPVELPELTLTKEQVEETYQAYIEYLAVIAEQKMKDESQAYLDAKEQEEGWQKTESGLLYKIIEPGDGQLPDSNDRVTVHYEGKLTDGTTFDSSYERGQPASFVLNQVVSGWTEGLQLMKPGAKFEFALPYDLAYGEQGLPRGGIPPYATLLFSVELLSFEALPDPPPAEEPGVEGE
ncbi:MAG: FKBP-type peptidyl-prolyl cis-trans isomerase [Planctomycetota bacterium]